MFTNYKFIQKNKDFVQLAGINLFSKIGDRLFYTIMLTIAATLTESNIAIMIIAVSETLPLLLGFFIGNIADKQHQKSRHLIMSSILRFGLYSLIALLLMQKPTFSLIIIIALLNFLSDLLGNYSSALIVPYTKLMVNAKDIGKAQSLISTTAQLISVASTFVGAYLLSIFSPSAIALINALLFLSVAAGFKLIKSSLQKVQFEKSLSPDAQSHLSTIKNNFKSLIANKTILNSLLQLAFLNGILGGILPLFVAFIQTSQIKTDTISLMIASFSAIVTLSIIIGNSISTSLFKKMTTNQLALIADIFVIGMAIGFIVNQLFVILVSTALCGLFCGVISPRFTTTIIKTFPVSHLGGIVTTTNSFLVIMPPLTSLLFPLISNINYLLAYAFIIIYALIALVTDIFLNKK